MLTKAFVEKLIDNNSAKIRIPIYNGIKGSAYATSEKDLYVAPFCVPPGCKFSLKVGDVVFVDFELDEPDHPVIMGVLQRDSDASTVDMTLGSLQVNVSCNLPYDTEIEQGKDDNIVNKEDQQPGKVSGDATAVFG